jgi:hypothetical protein
MFSLWKKQVEKEGCKQGLQHGFENF